MKLTIVIPTHNCAPYLLTSIGSVLPQLERDSELLIINDGSTDNTRELLGPFTQYPNVRITENPRPSGLGNVRNQALALARGRYLAWLDADDFSTADRFRRQMDVLDSKPHIGAVGSHTHTFGKLHELWRMPLSPDHIRFRMIFGNCMMNSTCMFRLDLARRHGLRFNQDLAPAEDYDFWLRLAQHAELTNVDDVLSYYRLHANQATHLQSERSRNALRSILGRQLSENNLPLVGREFDLHLRLAGLPQGDAPEPADIIRRYRVKMRAHISRRLGADPELFRQLEELLGRAVKPPGRRRWRTLLRRVRGWF
jgi:glycosyltransferase involved in cell wall biosynthesis